MKPCSAVWYGAGVVFFVVVVVVLIGYWQNARIPCAEFRSAQLKALIRQTARWTGASMQDESPMISLLHANYGAGYLQALELIATENEINQFSNLQKLRLKVYSAQDKAAQRVFAQCPNFIGNKVDKELVMMGINVKNDTTPN